jgi:hypothetical protein
MTTNSFSDRSNARRAARRMIDSGEAPATEFDITQVGDRHEIVWKTSEPAQREPVSTAAIEGEIAAANGRIANRAAAAPATASTEAEPGPAADDPELAAVATPRLLAEVERRGYRTRLAPKRAATRTNRTAAPRQPRIGKEAELDAAANRGVMPEKPDVTSHANHHYQKRFDKLAELAAAGDWAAVADYQCTGVNTYAKMVRRYRDRLVAAHAAQQAPQKIN